MNLEPENKYSLLELEDSEILNEIPIASEGITVLPESYREVDGLIVKADAGDFTKWIKLNAPEVEIMASEGHSKLALRSGDYWLPLVFLASDVSLPLYLNIVSNYLYEKMRGALRGDKARVHLSAVYEDKKEGKFKRFDFDGDAELLKSAIKKFDLNAFMDE
ncbi:hypothetical protein DFO67_10744 [Modicisalibacter xianhensis]|uniref:Uncharacterized protein n=1 Tax=Modicisalibacter xianhensis TaxID=442341 RepID=A0A4V3GUC0_9GAMM|nr:hypothetical protein [Halomonas xianhensis]TDX29368.1 hypothetical protein DFO67_10744 [Halomonas xianhensis]